MKDILQQWLAQRTQVSGVLACGIRFPDKTSLTQSWSKEFPVESLENAWRCVSDTFQVLKINFFPNQQIASIWEGYKLCGELLCQAFWQPCARSHVVVLFLGPLSRRQPCGRLGL